MKACFTGIWYEIDVILSLALVALLRDAYVFVAPSTLPLIL